MAERNYFAFTNAAKSYLSDIFFQTLSDDITNNQYDILSFYLSERSKGKDVVDIIANYFAQGYEKGETLPDDYLKIYKAVIKDNIFDIVVKIIDEGKTESITSSDVGSTRINHLFFGDDDRITEDVIKEIIKTVATL